MDLTHSFTVPAPLEETWKTFLDIEEVAGCFPGAAVTSVEGDDFKGTCKVKLGPIALVYGGQGRFVERDEGAHRFVVEAKGKDKRGNGTAGATVTATMASAADDSTHVEVVTKLEITGKPAQFGRGVMQDVSDKLLQQFMGCLESKVGAPEAPEAAAGEAAGAPAEGAPAAGPAVTPVTEAAPEMAPVEVPSGAAASAAAGAAAGPATGAGAAVTGVGGAAAEAPAVAVSEARRAVHEPVEALDLGATVLPILLRNYWKQLAGAGVVLLVLAWLIRRRRR